jgi:hypothetical protein
MFPERRALYVETNLHIIPRIPPLPVRILIRLLTLHPVRNQGEVWRWEIRTLDYSAKIRGQRQGNCAFKLQVRMYLS